MVNVETTRDWLVVALQFAGVFVVAVAAIFAFKSSRAASKSAQAAQRQVELQTRPLLRDVPQRKLELVDIYHYPNGGEYGAETDGLLPLNEKEGWLQVPLRNVGRGTAKIVETWLEKPPGHKLDVEPKTTSKYVPPGEQTRFGFIDRANGTSKPLSEALFEGRDDFVMRVTYSDLSDENLQQVDATLGTLAREFRVVNLEHPQPVRARATRSSSSARR